MRFAYAFLLAGVASATLVSRQSVPSCALTCIASADTGSCSSSDTACLCNDPAFISSTTTCIESSCSGDDLTTAEEFAQASCEAVGVTLTASSASATSSATGSNSSSASTATSAGSSSTTSSSAASSTSNAAQSNRVPVLAAAALGLAAFAL